MFNRLVIFLLILGAALFVFYFAQNFNSFSFDSLKATFYSAPKENPLVKTAEIVEEEPSLADEKNLLTTENATSSEDSQPAAEINFVKEENLTVEEIQEILDDLIEKIDILDQEMAELAKIDAIDEEKREKAEKISEDNNLPEKSEEIEKTTLELDEKIGQTVGQETGQKLCEKKIGDLPNRNKVIINEIAWMGSAVSANNEWIEFKNVSGQEINLNGWQLIDKDGQIKSILKGIIPINGFYLLERTNDDSVPGISADFIYTGVLNDTEEALYLFNENCVLEDEVLASPNWPAGDKEGRKSMERKNDLSWQTYQGEVYNNILGTPKRENSQPQLYFGGTSIQQPLLPPAPTICSQENLSLPNYSPIIFNEIAWMGSASSSNDEWIELKNLSTSTVSLNNWQIIGVNTNNNEINVKIFFDNTDTIPEDSYFLLERTDDDSVPGISADKIFTGSLNDSEFALRLFDDKCRLIDTISATSTWPAGQKENERKTIEREESLIPEGELLVPYGASWYTSYATSSLNGLFGTPKSENSQEPSPPPVLEISTTTIFFRGEEEEINIASQKLAIKNNGGGILDWSTSIFYDNILTNWLLIDQATGTVVSSASATIEIQVDVAGLIPGNYKATTTIEAVSAQNSPQEISVDLTIFPKTTKTVIINEVGWMGTGATTSADEWIEFYNNTNLTIDLTGWTLTAADGSPNITFPTSSIPAQEYFLLERTDDTTVSDITADLIYTGALGNNGEKLELWDSQGSLVDMVDCSLGWFAGKNIPAYISMERINSNLPGSYSDNWADNNGTIKNGLDANGNPISGTPKSKNGASEASGVPY